MCSHRSGAARPCRLWWAWRVPGSRQLMVHGPHARVLREPGLGVSLHRVRGVSARGSDRVGCHATDGETGVEFVGVSCITS